MHGRPLHRVAFLAAALVWSTQILASPIASDEFNSSSLDPSIWTFVNPVGDGQYTVNGGQLSISAPAGVPHDPWTTGNAAPRLMQSVVDQDFAIEVKLNSNVTQKYQMQGVMVEQDADTFVRAEVFFDGFVTRVYSAVINNGSASTKTNLALSSGVSAPIYLRLSRTGNVWTYDYSLNGTSWQTATTFTAQITMSAIGVYVGNFGGSSPPGHTAVFDYFKNLAAPPPSGQSYSLTTTVSGQGTVSLNPPGGTYVEGTVVEVTAVPAAGWSFDSWSGAATGSTNPVQVTVTSDSSVQALFVDVPEHQLSVTTTGSGSVSLNPPGGTYAEGAVVQVTATPAAGWSFDSWSGAVTGSANPVQVTVNSDLALHALFVDVPDYHVTVTTTGSGSVTLNPPGGTYAAGTTVQATAVPAAGWTFGGWSGTLAGTTNPATFVVSNDVAIGAAFSLVTGSLVLTDISVFDTGPTTARVVWTTNQNATSDVRYGIASTLAARASDASLTQAHSLDIDWLRCQQPYTIRISSSTPSGGQATAQVTHTTGQCWNPGIGMPPEIDLWDGNEIVFGDRGVAQRWVNVRGRVSTAHTLASLSYRLNGGAPRTLTVGPDFRRLSTKGDFNVEIDYAELAPGQNSVEITARDTDGRTTVKTATVNYVVTAPLSLPYTTYWADTGDVESWAYPVDGNWSVSNGQVWADTVDYDRLLVVGDVRWTDYEFTVPVTVNEHGPHAYHPYSNGPMVGLAIRWPGHTPLGSEKPSQYWYPTGGFVWYRWYSSGNNSFEMYGNNSSPSDFHQVFTFEFGVTYLFKAQVVTLANGASRYRFKVWKETELEPPAWHMEIAYSGGPTAGSIGLIAHHADARFGVVQVSPPTTP